jgi:mannan endo-1,4-beta-mannosidase
MNYAKSKLAVLWILIACTFASFAAQGASPPVSPSAKPEAAGVLSYLYGLPAKSATRVLAGQNIGHANGDINAGYTKYYTGTQQATGLLPGILAVDYGSEQMDPTGIATVNTKLINHWQNGGLVTISMHPSNPFTGGDQHDRSTGIYQFRDIVTPGTVPYQRWHAALDNVATGLAQLRDAGVIVLWRPMHEMNADNFWWSAGAGGTWVTPDEYKSLWLDMFNYFTNVKKLNNLLWVYSVNYQSNTQLKSVTYYYPGAAYVDVVGLDYYNNTMDLLNANNSYSSLVALGKPVALTEVGPAFWSGAYLNGNFDTRLVINGIRNNYPAITYFTFWHGWTTSTGSIKMAMIENLYADQLLRDPWVITLDKVSWRSGSTTTTTSATSSTTAATTTSTSATTTSSTTTTTAAAASCFTASNYAHITAGRAYYYFGYALANGSNQNMGFANAYVITTLKKTGANYYVIGTCN